jgi:hypothetical protein
MDKKDTPEAKMSADERLSITPNPLSNPLPNPEERPSSNTMTETKKSETESRKSQFKSRDGESRGKPLLVASTYRPKYLDDSEPRPKRRASVENTSTPRRDVRHSSRLAYAPSDPYCSSVPRPARDYPYPSHEYYRDPREARPSYASLPPT